MATLIFSVVLRNLSSLFPLTYSIFFINIFFFWHREDATNWAVEFAFDSQLSHASTGYFHSPYVAVPDHFMQVMMTDTMPEKCVYCTRTLRARLHYVTKLCDIGHMTVWSLLIMNSRQNPHPTHPPTLLPPWNPPPDFVLRGPNPFLKSDQIVMCPISHGWVM